MGPVAGNEVEWIGLFSGSIRRISRQTGHNPKNLRRIPLFRGLGLWSEPPLTASTASTISVSALVESGKSQAGRRVCLDWTDRR